MDIEETIRNVLGELYAGTLDDGAWHRAMTGVADLVGATVTHLVSVNPITGGILRDEGQRLDPLCAAAYRDHWSTKDILIAPCMRISVGEPTPDYKLVPLHIWEQSEIFNELALPYDTPYILPTLLHKTADKIVALSLRTSARHGPFHMDEARRLKTVIPHIRRALEIKDRLALSQVRSDTLATSLENVSFGVLILDNCGRVLEASVAAQSLMSIDSGIKRNPDGRLWMREPAGTEFYRWILTGTPPPRNTDGLLQVSRPDAPPISILMTPLPRKATSWIAGEPRWLLLLFDPERRLQASVELIAHDLGISVREAEIAALLASGYDINTIAQRIGISVHTVRTHVKAVFAKTGVRSQAELIQRIARGPAAVLRPGCPD